MIMALRLAEWGESWIVISPSGKIKQMSNDDFVCQIARPHTMEYDCREFCYYDIGENAEDEERFFRLLELPYKIEDLTKSVLFDFIELWRKAKPL